MENIMRTVNKGGTVQVPPSAVDSVDFMTIYDQLPPDVRETLRNAPYNFNTPNAYPQKGWAEQTKQRLPAIIQQSAAATYGPDHPQAQGEFLWPLRT
jgi:ABC-type glycerol-3-phosphate transport system substrate-binding protein